MSQAVKEISTRMNCESILDSIHLEWMSSNAKVHASNNTADETLTVVKLFHVQNILAV